MKARSLQIQAVTQYLRVLFRTVQAHSRYVEKQCGLSSAKLCMLNELNSQPGILVSKLAASLAIHPSTCSNMLDKLEEEGFVSRERSKTDQRAVHLSITEKGIATLAKAPQPSQGELEIALEKLSNEGLQLLEKGLGELVQKLQEKEESSNLSSIPTK